MVNDELGTRSRANLALIKSYSAAVDIDADRAKFTNLNVENGVAFDAGSNAVINNDLLDRADIAIDVLGITTNRVSNRLVLDASVLSDKLDLVSNKMDAIAALFGMTFDVDGVLTAENYTAHTHDYNDKTISDTGDGTGVETDTARVTAGVK